MERDDATADSKHRVAEMLFFEEKTRVVFPELLSQSHRTVSKCWRKWVAVG